MTTKEQHAKICIECENVFIAKRSTKKYCSDHCKNAWWTHRHPQQTSLFVFADRPAAAPICSVPKCGKHLYGYEARWGKCLYHKHSGIIQAREAVPVHLTDDATRTRTRQNYHTKKYETAPMALEAK
jgi:hypothetical protein